MRSAYFRPLASVQRSDYSRRTTIEPIITDGLTLTTSIGTVVVKVNGRECVYLSTHHSQPITVFGVRYDLTLHLGLYDGKWSLYRNKNESRNDYYLSALKYGSTDFRNRDASSAARGKILQVLSDRIAEWAGTQDAEGIFAQAEFDAAQKKLNEAVSAVTILDDQLKIERKKLEEARENLIAVRRVLSSAIESGKRKPTSKSTAVGKARTAL